jgi:hypothetical protein
LRHTILALLAAALLLIAWRVHALRDAGRELHRQEIAARGVAERILRAQRERRASPPPRATIAPYEYLSALVAEGRVDGLVPVDADPHRELFRAGAYLFHVRLLNRLGRPLPRRPADPAAEPGLGNDFELWAWPADPGAGVLPVLFASDAGYLLQGDNGSFAGPEARPEDVTPGPLQVLEARSPRGATDQWIMLLHLDS